MCKENAIRNHIGLRNPLIITNKIATLLHEIIIIISNFMDPVL